MEKRIEKRIGGRTRRITLGSWPALAEKEARRRARLQMMEVSAGQGLITRRTSRRMIATTVGQAFHDYGAARRSDGSPKSRKVQTEALSVLDRYLSEWKDQPLSSITRPMVQQRYRELCRRTVAQANRTMRILRAAFNLAARKVRDADQRPMRIDNPVSVLRGQWVELPWRTRVMTPEESRRWLAAVHALGDSNTVEGDPCPRRPRDASVYCDLFLFLALTGCRLGEALRLQWSHVDWHDQRFTFVKPKNRRDHVLPITGLLQAVLARRMIASKSPRVFGTG